MLKLLGRLMASEMTKLFSLRSTWVVLPLAAVLGIIASLIMCGQAVVAIEIMKGQVSNWKPIQVMHWIRLITSTLLSLWAIVSITGEYRAGTLPLTFRSTQRASLLIIAKWLVTGVISAVITAITIPVSLLMDMVFFPSVTDNWSLSDPDVIHVWWALPLYSFLICGIGVGLGALARTATLGVGVFLLWQFVLEPFSLVIPFAAKTFAYLPFNNGGVLIGEATQFPLPIDGWVLPAICLALWTCVACAAGWWAMTKRLR